MVFLKSQHRFDNNNNNNKGNSSFNSNRTRQRRQSNTNVNVNGTGTGTSNSNSNRSNTAANFVNVTAKEASVIASGGYSTNPPTLDTLIQHMYGKRHMRFQHEREVKQLEMNGDSAKSARGELTMGTKPLGNGKVRQMFEQSRSTRVYRTNPLKPITINSNRNTPLPSTDSTNTTTPNSLWNNNPSISLNRKQPQALVNNKQSSIGSIQSKNSSNYHQQMTNGNRHMPVPDAVDNIGDETLPNTFKTLSLANDRLNNGSGGGESKSHNNNHHKNEPNKAATNIKLNPVVTKKSPSVAVAKNTPTASSLNAKPLSGSANSNKRSTKSNSEKTVIRTSTKSPTKTSGKKMTTPAVTGSPSIQQMGPPPAGTVTCQFCKRSFNAERIAKHEDVCQKMANSKRKVFDAAKHRLKGTESERYMKKPPNKLNQRQNSTLYASGPKIQPKKNNWRQKHEDFITAIRSAKQVQAHLARGGRLADLPPPPPSENPDYIQCPHCSRRFNQAAAERHIPRCATMLHNKPKPVSVQQQRKK